MTTFNDAYLGQPPWDIGEPQPVLVTLAEAGEIHAPVLDIGCGTGDNALFLAARGLEVWGIDAAPRAIAKAKRKAHRQKLEVVFREFDALNLAQLGRTFETVIDSGLFHSFDDEQRPLYAGSVQSVLNTGGTLFMLCFSDKEPPGWGPRRVSPPEIRATFERGWEVLWIREATFKTVIPDRPEVQAYLSAIRKTVSTSPGVW